MVKRIIRQLSEEEMLRREEILITLPPELQFRIALVMDNVRRTQYWVHMKARVIISLRDGYGMSFPEIALLLKYVQHDTPLSIYHRYKGSPKLVTQAESRG